MARNTVYSGFHLSPAGRQALDEYAADRGQSIGHIVRQALSVYLDDPIFAVCPKPGRPRKPEPAMTCVKSRKNGK